MNVPVIGSTIIAIAGAVRQNCGFPGSPPMSTGGQGAGGVERWGGGVTGRTGPTGESTVDRK